MITRDQAWKLLTEKMQSQNLRRHCLSVEVVMRALAKHFGGDEEKCGIVGLLHDGGEFGHGSAPGLDGSLH